MGHRALAEVRIRPVSHDRIGVQRAARRDGRTGDRAAVGGAGTGQGVTVALNELTAMPCPPFQISKPNSISIMNQARWS